MTHGQQRSDILALVYHKWTECFNILKEVREEENDGSVDWSLFHNERLQNADALEDNWNMAFIDLKKEWTP